MSVDQGHTVSFKIDDTAGAPYHIDIYRMGYYQGERCPAGGEQLPSVADPAPTPTCSLDGRRYGFG